MMVVNIEHAYGGTAIVVGIDTEQPVDSVWFSSTLQVVDSGGTQSFGVVSLMRGDVEGLIREFRTWLDYGQPLEFESTDGNLIVQGGNLEADSEKYLQVFVGERHEALEGRRIIVRDTELRTAKAAFEAILDSL